MHVAIIGAGTVGRALATGLSRADHRVTLGVRHPDDPDLRSFLDARPDLDVTSVRDAAAAGDAVVLAVPGSVVADVAADVADAVAGKPLLDPTNRYPDAPARPLARRVADAAPEADVVKAFNTIGADRMATPRIDGRPATMFVAGDDPDATGTAATLASDLGFDPVDAGDLSAAGHLESLARFWIHLSGEYGRDIGFSLLRE